MPLASTSRRTATALCVAALSLFGVACSVLSSSDDFVLTDQDAASTDTSAATEDTATADTTPDPDLILCTALCDGLSTCDGASSSCVEDCTQALGSEDDTIYDCYLGAVDEATDESEDPDDIEDAASVLCNLLHFQSDDVAQCDQTLAECDLHCKTVQSLCTKSSVDIVYETCVNACITLKESDIGFLCALTDRNKIELDTNAQMSSNEILLSCSVATKGCQERVCKAISDPNKPSDPSNINDKQYQCLEACNPNVGPGQTPCPAGTYCEDDPRQNEAGNNVFCLPLAQCGNQTCNPGEHCGMNSSGCTCGDSMPAFSCGPNERCVQSDGVGPADMRCACGAEVATLPGKSCGVGQVCTATGCAIGPNP
jgi:hypothetical protein